MNTIEDVRTMLSAVCDGIKDGTIDTKKASELTNAAGKIIGSLKVELEYYALRKEKPEIGYFKKGV